MPGNPSRTARALSWAAVLCAILTTVVWASAFDYRRGGIYAMGNLAVAFVAVPASIGVLLLAVIPNAVLYARTRQSGDGLSLCLAAGSFAVVLLEIVLLVVLPTLPA